MLDEDDEDALVVVVVVLATSVVVLVLGSVDIAGVVVVSTGALGLKQKVLGTEHVGTHSEPGICRLRNE